jgi:hypothetical protein
LFIDSINAKFQMNLVNPTSNMYDNSLLHTLAMDAHRASLIASSFPQALDIYQELNAKELLLGGASELGWLEQIKGSPERGWAFQDWLNIRKLEREVKRLRSESEQL